MTCSRVFNCPRSLGDEIRPFFGVRVKLSKYYPPLQPYETSSMGQPIVGIVMGSESDWPVMQKAVAELNSFDVPFEVRVLSAHRTPSEAKRYAETASERGLRVLIAGAGGAAHLAGVLAGCTTLPVIGVPISSPDLNGMDSLLATVQMPSGVPVATVAIGGSKNAAVLAVQVLALSDPPLAKRFARYKSDMQKRVHEMDARVQALAADL